MERTHRQDRIPAEHLLDCVWRMDLDLRITYVSPVAESMFGIPANVLVGSSLSDHTTAEDLQHLRDTLSAALASGDRTAGLVHETRIKHADGRLIPLEVHSRLLLDSDGQPLELLGVARDIGGRRDRERRDRLQEQSRLENQKMEAVARLAGGVFDDFHSLVADLDGNLQSSEEPEPSPLLSRAAERVAQLATLAGRLELQREDLDIDLHVAETLAGARENLPPGVELMHRPGAGGSTVWADPHQIERVVSALVANALEAVAGDGSITVSTGLRAADPVPDGPPSAPPRPWITIEVRDTGPGFDHATRERILEPFFTTTDGGAGLGLALAHGIVTQHEGSIEAESRPGQGAVFRVLLPARFVDDILAGEPDAGEHVSTQTVLLVDDDPDIRNYCERVLRSGGYQVVSCEDGVDALAVIAGGEPLDAVVLDWALPGLDGRRVREQIARRHPDLPLLVISGHASKDYEALGGIDSETPWLAKPFTPPALLEAVRAMLPPSTEERGS